MVSIKNQMFGWPSSHDNNSFILELSELDGSFNNPTQLEILHDFYTPLINSNLPSNLSPGNYKLRVRATLDYTGAPNGWSLDTIDYSNYKIFIYPRKGTLKESPYIINKNAMYIGGPRIDLSSTNIRNILSKKSEPKDLISLEVMQYIHANKLYQWILKNLNMELLVAVVGLLH